MTNYCACMLYQTTLLESTESSNFLSLCDSSSNETVSELTKLEYQEAFRKSGYKSTLKYSTPRKKQTYRNIWFYPPFNKNVITNVAKVFFSLLEKHFPKSSRLNEIFNRNTVKKSYSCTGNISHIIKRHNEQVTKTNKRSIAPCNCRDKKQLFNEWKLEG